MKSIQEYLQYYMNATYMAIPQHALDRKPVEARIKTWYNDGTEIEMIEADAGKDWPAWFTFYADIKPILRPLSDMTEEEMHECGNMVYDFSDEPDLNKWEPKDFEIGLAPEQFQWLLSKGFDIFNLIRDGLAINKTTLKP